jgi:cephalosporin-C deacetylase
MEIIMYFICKQLEDLQKIDATLTRQNDFDSFWHDAVKKVKKHDLKLKTVLYDYPLNDVTIYDTVFHGLDGTPIESWVILPRQAANNPVPAVVWFHGGGGRRERPFDYLHWLMAGFAVIVMDFRQQGGHTGSNTPMDRFGADSFAVMNIEKHDSYYLYHAWTDAMLSIRIAEQIPEIDPARIVVAGSSQGGGTAMVMAALNNNISICLAMVPSFCWWDRRVFIRTGCGKDLAHFIERYPDKMETVFKTMSYYDVINFADKIKCPVMVSCGLKDEATPPECVYAAYNKITSEKYIHNYPFGGHVIEPLEIEKQLRFIRERL